ncbi:MAG TPA: PucR family transcriptional regulator ligand-binding domain-containing protein [Flexivirga sp.]|uniref:PucR family transcriptional regulator n=1 Tax=Flexivirga sp. TaxID=1962927 RepID=UPI002CE856AB|nr:PucR family transcriptional regulator ligand-binding domain-containing protein [Flexivirga sp.]HWC20688.1 PucR family transcriptional regulator ligand-binding domain-containing protein [Flexivirga sp.]
MQLMTLAEVIELAASREGQPEVLHGHEHLSDPVRWCHVGEVPDIGTMLTGGEVVLTTGVMLAEERDQIEYVEKIAEAGATAVFLGIGRAFDDVPRAMLKACRSADLPLIVMWRPVAFVTITEQVQTTILARTTSRSTISENVRDTLHQLTIQRAPMQSLVDELAGLAGCPVVVENTARQVQLAAGEAGLREVLRDWTRLSQYVSRFAGDDDVHITPDGIVAATLTQEGRPWGTLILFAHGEPAERSEVVARRGVEALNLHKLVAPSGGDWQREAQEVLLTDLLGGHGGADLLELRARASGFRVRHCRLTPLVVRLGRNERQCAMLLEQVRSVAGRCGVGALLGPIEHGTVRMLVSSSQSDDPIRRVDEFAEQLAAESDCRIELIAAGPVVDGLSGLGRSFARARQTLRAAARVGWQDSVVVRLADLRLPGLVEALAASHDVQDFVDRELGPLLDSPDLIDLLETFIANGLNKSSTAQAHHLSRPAVYRRLEQITERLGIDLDDVRAVAGLYVALLALRARGQ